MTDPLDSTTFIRAFRQCSPYINAQRKKTVVINLDGQALASDYLTRVIYDIALLNSLGVRIVLVMSARSLIAKELDKLNIKSEFHKGIRITSEQILETAQQVSGKYRYDVEAKFSNALPNTPMHGSNIKTVSGNFVSAKPLGIIDGVNYQFSAAVRKIEGAAINAQLDNDAIVLLSNIAYSATGECFNVKAEDVAIETAKAIHADKFIIYASDAQLQDLPKEIMLDEALQLQNKMEKKNHNFSFLIQAAQAKIERCHMISFEQDGALLSELYTTDGSGVLLSQNPFESIRQASSTDIIDISHLLEPLEKRGNLIQRDRDSLERDIQHFVVIERDQRIIACAALIPYGERAEIASVATHPDYQGGKRASQIIRYLEKRAQQQGFSDVFVLTTQTTHFFLEQGYQSIAIEQLPESKQVKINRQRNAQALIKKL